MSNVCISSNALHLLKSNCRVVDISDRRATTTPPPSNYTSHGKRKARRSDPINKIEDIQTIKEYFLNNGRETLRLRNYMLFVVGISVGLRGCDLLRLKIKDVVNANGHIVDELSCYESKTHKMNHPILNDAAKDAIAEYINSLSYFNVDDYLFRAEGRSEPMSPTNLYIMMHNVETRLGLPYHLGAHSLRKTFAYWTIRLHDDNPNVIYSLQEMLNHNDLKTTLHYSGHTHEHLKTMYKDMSDVISGNIEVPSITQKKEDKFDKILALLMSNDDE